MRRPGTLRLPHQVLAAEQAERQRNARRRAESETRRLYGTSRWRRIAALHLAEEPLCRFCLADGVIEPARVCDHIEPHRGDVDKFWSGPFQSLCKACHDRDKQRMERRSGGATPGGV